MAEKGMKCQWMRDSVWLALRVLEAHGRGSATSHGYATMLGRFIPVKRSNRFLPPIDG